MLYEANEDTTLSNYDERDILSDFSSDIAIDSILMQIDKIFDENDVPKNSSDLFNIIIHKFKNIEIWRNRDTFSLNSFTNSRFNYITTIPSVNIGFEY